MSLRCPGLINFPRILYLVFVLLGFVMVFDTFELESPAFCTGLYKGPNLKSKALGLFNGLSSSESGVESIDFISKSEVFVGI